MVLGRIQRSEVVVIGLDLRSLIDIESHAGENVHDLVLHLGVRMKVSSPDLHCRNSDVDLLFLIPALQLQSPCLLFHLLKILQDPVLQLVHALAEFRFLFRGAVPHLFHEPVYQASLAVQVLFPELIDRGRIHAFLRFGPELFPNGLKLCSVHRFSPFVFMIRNVPYSSEYGTSFLPAVLPVFLPSQTPKACNAGRVGTLCHFKRRISICQPSLLLS